MRVHIQVPISREDEAVNFYARLGFEVKNGKISIWTNNDVALQIKLVEEVVNSSVCSLFSLNVGEDLSAKCAAWIRDGVKFEGVYMHPGGLTAIISDPFGNLIEFEGEDEGFLSVVEWERFDFFKRF